MRQKTLEQQTELGWGMRCRLRWDARTRDCLWLKAGEFELPSIGGIVVRVAEGRGVDGIRKQAQHTVREPQGEPSSGRGRLPGLPGSVVWWPFTTHTGAW